MLQNSIKPHCFSMRMVYVNVPCSYNWEQMKKDQLSYGSFDFLLPSLILQPMQHLPGCSLKLEKCIKENSLCPRYEFESIDQIVGIVCMQ